MRADRLRKPTNQQFEPLFAWNAGSYVNAYPAPANRPHQVGRLP